MLSSPTPPWTTGEHASTSRWATVQRSDGRRKVRLPRVVEIEVGSRCNRRCSYCPVSLDPFPDVPKKMEMRVFRRLLEGLEDLDFRGRLSYHFYNEPLLRRDLESFVGEAAERLPQAAQVIYTNGDLLSDRRYASLREAGVDWFVVTRHDGDGEDFPERPAQTVLVPKDLTLTNRGGSVSPPRRALQLPCYVPTEMLIVTVTGDVMLCYEDAWREHSLGNIMERELLEIWTDDRFVEARRRLEAGMREGTSTICSQCDNRAHTEPGMSLYSP